MIAPTIDAAAAALVAHSVPEPNSGCRLWLLSTNPNGYGQMWVGSQKWLCHRLAWTVFRGPIPDGLCTLHACDVPSCWWPDHLWLGTVADNNRDAARKGRNAESKRDRCDHGHMFTADNTRARAGGKWRACKKCDRIKAVFDYWRFKGGLEMGELKRQEAIADLADSPITVEVPGQANLLGDDA